MKNMPCSLWALVCLVGLTGCANLQERMSTRSAGSAASMPPPPPIPSLDAPPPPPSADFGALPPSPAPPTTAITQPPSLDNDLAEVKPVKSASSKTTVKADKLYNLGSKPAPKVASKAPAKKNSTLSRLASKAAPAKLDLAEPAKAASESSSTPSPKTAEADAPAPATVAAETTIANPVAESETLPSPGASTSGEEDTSFLATPVRKGEGSKEKSPQSNLAPKNNNREHAPGSKSTIVPVSNPADDDFDDFDGRSYS